MPISRTSQVTLEFSISWDEGEQGVDEPYPVFSLETVSPRGIFSERRRARSQYREVDLDGVVLSPDSLNGRTCPVCTGEAGSGNVCLCDADSVAETVACVGGYEFLENCLSSEVFAACIGTHVPKRLRITGHAVYSSPDYGDECDEEFIVRSYELTDI